jgi:hypothetical protein
MPITPEEEGWAMPQTLVSSLGLSNIASAPLDEDAEDADGADKHQPIKPYQHAKTSIVYRCTYEAALGASSWST